MPFLREILLAVTILIGVALLVLLVVGWRRRVRRQGGVASPKPTPALPPGAKEWTGKYVATTTAGNPYDRIAAAGLGFRGDAVASVHADGLLIRRTGEIDLWIPREDLLGVDRATWTIDRVVERDGLHLIRWRLGVDEVDTYLRLDAPTAFDTALAQMELIAS